MTLAVGQILQNRYRITSLLGQGGMGAVYRAWDARLDVPVALKEMTPQPGLDPQTLDQLRRQFRQEATILARLDHQNLVRVTDFFEEGGNAYLVMDFVEGEALADRIEREGALPERQVVTWAKELLSALVYCHNRNVIHRDIKPHNIVICPDGRVELVDFGLVKLWDPDDPHTHTAMRGLGTPEYAPPEQYGTQGGHTDLRSDIYSLGATLYHALAGQPPPAAGRRIASPDCFAPLRQLNPGVSNEVEAVVLKAMALRLDGRFQGAQEMADALDGRAPVTTTSPAASRPLLGRRSALIWGAVLGGLVFVLGGVGAVVLAGNLLASWAAPPTTATPVSRSATATSVSRPGATTVPATPVPPGVGGAFQWPVVPIAPEDADLVVQLTRWGRGTVEGVAYSSGGLFAVASSLGVYLYDAETLEEVRFIETGAWVYDVAFSPDGTLVSAATGEETLLLWRVADGMLLAEMEGHRIWPSCVAFSPGGETLASGSIDKTVRVWRVADGTLLHTLASEGFVRDVAFSPDGTLVAAASADGTVRMWRVSDGALQYVLEGHEGDVEAVAFSPDGKTLASGAEDNTVRVWGVASGELLQTLQVPSRWVTNRVLSVGFTPDGETLAVGSADGVVRLLRVSDGALLHAMEGHESRVTGVALSPGGERLLSASEDGTVRVWQVSTGTPLGVLEGHLPSVGKIALSADGKSLAVAADYDLLQVWEVDAGGPAHTLDTDAGELAGVVFSPAGDILASASWQGVKLWQVNDGDLLRELEGDGSRYVKSLALSPRGDVLAAGTPDGVVRLSRFSDGTPLRVLEGAEKAVVSVAFSPDGDLLAGGSWDETVRVWGVSDGVLYHTLVGHEGWVTSVAFSPDGATLASGSWDRTIKLWRVSDGALLQTLEGHTGYVEDVAFSPDGRTLVSASADGTVRLWRVSDGTALRILDEHAGGVNCVAFSLDGKALVSGSEDGTVRWWGVEGR